MSNPPNGFNTNIGFNKYKGTYFNNDIDVSGGNIISRSGDLYLADKITGKKWSLNLYNPYINSANNELGGCYSPL